MSSAVQGIVDVQALGLLRRAVSVIVATRDAALQPHVVRALGFRLDAATGRVAVLLDEAASSEVVADARANGQVAVVFSEPSTHCSIQLKGRDARIEPTHESDGEIVAAYVRRMVGELGSIGFPAELVQGLFGGPSGHLVVLAFTPTEAFEQTPGPAAGQQL